MPQLHAATQTSQLSKTCQRPTETIKKEVMLSGFSASHHHTLTSPPIQMILRVH